jgi:hypothetical protein
MITDLRKCLGSMLLDTMLFMDVPLTHAFFDFLFQHFAVKFKYIGRRNYWGSSVRISTQQVHTDHILYIRPLLEKKMGKYNEVWHRLFIDIKKAYDLLRKKGLYNILIEFGIPMKLVKLIKMSLTEKYSRFGQSNICLARFLS